MNSKGPKTEMASLYVEEHQGDGSVHYHVLLLIFDTNQLPVSPEKTRNWMQSEVFRRWNKVNGDALYAGANKLNQYQMNQRSLEYLLKGISVTKTQGRTVNWWGCRNKALIRANSSPVSNADVSRVFGEVFPQASIRRSMLLLKRHLRATASKGSLL